MSTTPPRLAPIFRSHTQLQIRGATYLEPERHFTIPELVERSGRPQPTVAREVDRLVTVWAATTSPIFDELHSILLKTTARRPSWKTNFADCTASSAR